MPRMLTAILQIPYHDKGRKVFAGHLVQNGGHEGVALPKTRVGSSRIIRMATLPFFQNHSFTDEGCPALDVVAIRDYSS
jgi:hypothetical protein